MLALIQVGVAVEEEAPSWGSAHMHQAPPPHGSLSRKSVLPGQLMSDEGLALPALRASPDAVMGEQRRVRQRSQKELSSAGCQRDSAAGDSTCGLVGLWLGRAGTY